MATLGPSDAPRSTPSAIPSVLWYSASGALCGFAHVWASNHGLPGAGSGAYVLFTPLYYLSLAGGVLGGGFFGVIAGFVLSVQKGPWRWICRGVVAVGAVVLLVLALRGVAVP